MVLMKLHFEWISLFSHQIAESTLARLALAAVSLRTCDKLCAIIQLHRGRHRGNTLKLKNRFGEVHLHQPIVLKFGIVCIHVYNLIFFFWLWSDRMLHWKKHFIDLI